MRSGRNTFSKMRIATCAGALFYAFACSSGGSETSSCSGATPVPPTPTSTPNSLAVRINDNLFNYAETMMQNFLSDADTKESIRSLLSSTDALLDDCLSIPLLGNTCLAIFIEDNDRDFSTDRNGNAACDTGETFTDTNADGEWQKGEAFTDAAAKGYDHDANAATGNRYYDPGEMYTDCDANPGAAWPATCTDGADADTSKYKHYVVGSATDPGTCSAAKLFFDRDLDGVNDSAVGPTLDFTPTISITPDLGTDGVADTQADIDNGTVDDYIDITMSLTGFALDLVIKPNPKADGCGDDGLCGAPNDADDEPEKYVSAIIASGDAVIPALNLTAGVGVVAGDFSSGNAPANAGTQVGISLDPLDISTGAALALSPETANTKDQSHFFTELLPYIEIATLRYLTEGYDAALDFFVFNGLPLLDLKDTFGGAFPHPLNSGTNLAIGLGINFGMTAVDDQPDGTADGILLRGGFGMDLASDGVNCVDATGTSALSWATTLVNLTNTDPGGNPYMIGAAIHQNALSKVIYNAIKSGALCLTIDNTALGGLASGGGLPLDVFSTDTFGLLMPKLIDADYGNLGGKQMRFVLRPTFKDPRDGVYTALEDTPYILGGGSVIDLPASNPYGDVSPWFEMLMPHLTLDFQVDTSAAQDGSSWQRIFGLDLATGMSMGIGIERDTGCAGCYVTTMMPRITFEADPSVDAFLWYDEAFTLVGASYDPNNPSGTVGGTDPSVIYPQLEGVLSSLLPTLMSGLLQADILPRIEISKTLGIGDPTAAIPRGIALTTSFVGGAGADASGGLPANDPEVSNTSGDSLGMAMSIVEDLDGDCTAPELANGIVDPCESENYLNSGDIWNLVCGDLLYESIASDSTQASTAELICKMCAGANHCPNAGNDPANCETSLPAKCDPNLAPQRFTTDTAQFADLAPRTAIQLSKDMKGDHINLLGQYESADRYGLDPLGGSVVTVSAEDHFTEASDMVYSHRLDGGAWSHFRSASQIELPTLLEGHHQLEVISKNRLGVVDSSPAVAEFWMDHVGPSITITGLDGQTRVTTPDPSYKIDVFDFVAPGSQLFVLYRLDGSEWEGVPSNSTVQLAGLSEGNHTLQVQASDPAGNGSSREVVFDVVSPVAEKESGGGCAMVRGTNSGGLLLPLIALGLALLTLRRRDNG